jgi:hypothetical protein
MSHLLKWGLPPNPQGFSLLCHPKSTVPFEAERGEDIAPFGLAP